MGLGEAPGGSRGILFRIGEHAGDAMAPWGLWKAFFGVALQGFRPGGFGEVWGAVEAFSHFGFGQFPVGQRMALVEQKEGSIDSSTYYYFIFRLR